MKLNKINRRNFILTALLAAPFAAAADAWWIEPTWLTVNRPRLVAGPVSHRLVQFSDIHHKGDRDYLLKVVNTINALSPDFTFFTGDLIERAKFLPEALEILSGIKSPMFGVPGNHDYWSRVSFEPIRECFAATGGAWLMDESRIIADGKIQLLGITCLRANDRIPPSNPAAKNILLMHYPAHAKRLGGRTFDLILAGHSHGGQVRIPFYGPVIVPPDVDEYDLGLFQTKGGPLYVNAGIGYIGDNDFRFNCPPEITVIEI
jgi:predicted MPP superfamily phosphohydrolase